MENKVSIQLSSHNINGFASSEHFISTKCDENENRIICVQEHWLRPAFKNIRSINQLRSIHPSFDGYGVSAMTDIHSSTLTKGRPYGGTGFVFSKKFAPFLQPVLHYEGDRISVMKLMDVDFTILIINVYCPFKQSGEEHRVEYLDLLGRIRNIISANLSSKIILLGDFNYDIFNDSQYLSGVLREFANDFGLIPTHSLDPSFQHGQSYTRSCVKRNTFSLIDFIFVSSSLRNRVKACSIDYDGRNPSDHFPVEMQLEVVPLITGDVGQSVNVNAVSRVHWSSLKSEDIFVYEQAMEQLLDSVQVPCDIIHGSTYCSCPHHMHSIERYFESLISVIEIAHTYLPTKSALGKKGKGFWTDKLTRLKNQSVDAFNAWNSDGKPLSGPSFDNKKHSHYVYKAELRCQRRMYAAGKSEALGDQLVAKRHSDFWREWKKVSQVKSPPVSRVGDAITETDIAAVFQSFFQGIYGTNGTEEHKALQDEFNARFPDYFHSRRNDSISPYLLTWDDMVLISGKLKEGKCTNSMITAEHILYGSPKLMTHLHILFNALFIHGLVPNDFLTGTISPTVKNSTGDINSANNYRGITLCSIFSQLFENALRLKFGHFLGSDDLQFGFKPKHSTNHAVYTLKSCVDYFTKRGSNVYVAFLDFSKAFDTISHYGLFLKLMNRKVPLCFLLMIMFWYLNMSYDVKWAGSRSSYFDVLCGTKQGGILSPDFFAIYIDDLIADLKRLGVGCHIIKRFIACLLFADDMSLIAPTRESMQQMLNVCATYCRKFCLQFNVNKTKVMVFGKLSNATFSLANISFQGVPLEYVQKCKYLGFHIVSSLHFKLSIHEDLCGFFASANSILNSMVRPKENVLMQLLFTNCVPRLTYGAAIKDLNASERRQLNVAVNNAMRRIFKFRQWQSIRHLREFYGFKSIETMFEIARSRFAHSLTNHSNGILRFLSSLLEST